MLVWWRVEAHTYCLLYWSFFQWINIEICSSPMKPPDGYTRTLFFFFFTCTWIRERWVLPPFKINTQEGTPDQELGYWVEDLRTGRSFWFNSPTLEWTSSGSFPLPESTQRQEPMIESLATQVMYSRSGRFFCLDSPTFGLLSGSSTLLLEWPHRMEPMIKTLGFEDQGWFPDVLKRFQSVCKNVLCDHIERTNPYRHSGYADERFTYSQIPFFFFKHAWNTERWVPPPLRIVTKGRNPQSRSQLLRWRIYILEVPFVLIYPTFDQWGVDPPPFQHQNRGWSPWSRAWDF